MFGLSLDDVLNGISIILISISIFLITLGLIKTVIFISQKIDESYQKYKKS